MATEMDARGSSSDNATAEAIEAAAFIQSLMRYLNCLSDQDRTTRRRALEHLDKRLTKENPPTGLMLQIIWDETICRILLRCLHDSVEKCRESAVNLIIDVLNILPDVKQTTSLAIPVIAERIGQMPVLEPSEEIRLSLVKLLVLLTSRCSVESIHETFEPLSKIICLSLADSFHEVKKAACRLLSETITHAPNDENTEATLKALIPNVTHAHSRVRLAVLSALERVVLHGLPARTVGDIVAPGIKGTPFDHSDAVREVVFASIARWLGYEGSEEGRTDPQPYLPHLLPLLLLGITDESAEISQKALALTEGVGVVYQQFSSKSSADEMSNNSLPEGLPPPFKGQPGLGSRLMVQSIFGHIVRICLKDLHDWTTITRLGAARLLQTSLIFVGSYASSFLDRLIPSLASAASDQQVAIAKRVVQSAHILGSHIRPDSWIDLVMDPVINSRSTDAQKANSLVILAALLYGCHPGLLEEKSVLQISSGLSQADLLDGNLPVRRQVFAVLNNLIVKGGILCKICSKEIFTLLLQLQSGETEFQFRYQARCLIETFAKTIGYEATEDLYAAHMADLMTQAVAGKDEWLSSSPRKCLFQTVLQTSGVLAGPYLKDILPVFISCLRPDRDPALRIDFLQLLDELFEIVGLETSWSPLAKEVLQRVLIPCGVWQPGKVGAAVRHATMVAVGTFLRRELCSQADMLELLDSEEVLPVVSSCLDEDFYVDTRRATCHVVENIVHIAGSSLKDEHRVKIGTLLQKRLDDSNDEVRLGILRAIFAFFSSLPSSYDDSEVRGFLSSLVLHMDDQNLQIKDAVCRSVEQCALRRPGVVIEIVKDVRNKHQSTQYCDYLLTVAASVQAREEPTNEK